MGKKDLVKKLYLLDVLHKEGIKKRSKNRGDPIIAVVFDDDFNLITIKRNKKDTLGPKDKIKEEKSKLHAERLCINELNEKNGSYEKLNLLVTIPPCNHCFKAIEKSNFFKTIFFLYKYINKENSFYNQNEKYTKYKSESILENEKILDILDVFYRRLEKQVNNKLHKKNLNRLAELKFEWEETKMNHDYEIKKLMEFVNYIKELGGKVQINNLNLIVDNLNLTIKNKSNSSKNYSEIIDAISEKKFTDLFKNECNLDNIKKHKLFKKSTKEISLCLESWEKLDKHTNKTNKTDSIIKNDIGFNLIKDKKAIRINKKFKNNLNLKKYDYDSNENTKYFYIIGDKNN